jgi:hypothetical protein
MDKKLIDNLKLFQSKIIRNEGANVNRLSRVKNVLMNWLKESEGDNLEYSKFEAEKKIKYILKNKERTEIRLKALDTDLNALRMKIKDLQTMIGDIYINYDVEEMTLEIQRFSNAYEVVNGKSPKMIAALEEMKEKLPFLKEYIKLKESEANKSQEKKESERILKNSMQTLYNLTNYHRNIKNKLKEF